MEDHRDNPGLGIESSVRGFPDSNLENRNYLGKYSKENKQEDGEAQKNRYRPYLFWGVSGLVLSCLIFVSILIVIDSMDEDGFSINNRSALMLTSIIGSVMYAFRCMALYIFNGHQSKSRKCPNCDMTKKIELAQKLDDL